MMLFMAVPRTLLFIHILSSQSLCLKFWSEKDGLMSCPVDRLVLLPVVRTSTSRFISLLFNKNNCWHNFLRVLLVQVFLVNVTISLWAKPFSMIKWNSGNFAIVIWKVICQLTLFFIGFFHMTVALWQIWRWNFVSPCRYSSVWSIDGRPARWWNSRQTVWTENISWKKRYIFICCMFLYLHTYIQKCLTEMREFNDLWKESAGKKPCYSVICICI